MPARRGSRTPMNSCRRSRRSRDSGCEHTVDVLVGPHRRQGGDARPFPRFALVLDDHLRQDAAVPQVPQRDGELRAGFLVGPVARGTLYVAVEPAEHWRGRVVRGRDAGVEAIIPAGGRLLSRTARAHRQGARRLDCARGRAAGIQIFWSWRRSLLPARSLVSSALCSAS